MLKQLVATIALAVPLSAFALSSSFTYQASLNDGGNPATGSYDLQFQLQTNAGANVGAPLVREDVAVAGGQFSVELDFGTAITSADFRLQIGVRPGASTGGYTTLSPTTNLRPTPQAQVAGIASEAVTVSPDSITSASIQSGAVTTSDIADNAVLSSDIADGTVANADLAANSVNAANIVDGSVGSADVNSAQVQARVTGTCAVGSSIRDIAANGTVTCETDDGTGTVTSVASGGGLTGGPITTSGTLSIATGGVTGTMIADATVANADLAPNSVNAGNIVDGSVGSADVNTAQVQVRIATGCIVGSSIRQVNADGTIVCESDDIGWSLGGNLGTNPTTNYIGTFDAQPFVVRTQNAQSLRIEPSSTLFAGLPATRNMIGGSHANGVSAGVRGATIAGGGLPSGDSDPDLTLESQNLVSSHYGTVGGGYANIAGTASALALSSGATVAGGIDNRAVDYASSVGGGRTNRATATGATVGGGTFNTAAALGSTVAGGENNCAGGRYSFAGGQRAEVRVPAGLTAAQLGDGCAGVSSSGDSNGDEGTFVWADAQASDFVSSGSNQYLIRAAGGFLFNTNSLPNFVDDFVIKARSGNGDSNTDLTLVSGSGKVARIELGDSSGSILLIPNDLGASEPRLIAPGGVGGVATLSNGGTWTNASSRSYKTGFVDVDPMAILDRLIALPISTWTYRGSGEGTHLGPMAEDFKAAFGLAGDGKSIATVDADGVALAAIQGLNQKLEAENAALRAELAELRALVMQHMR